MQQAPRSIAEAGHRGDRQLVETELSSGDPTRRKAALGAAHRLEFLDYEFLKKALADPSAMVRARAIELAPRVVDQRDRDDPTLRGRVAAAVADLLDDPACAEVAAFALGELAWPEGPIVAQLEQQARHHDDPLCRESAVAALGALGTGRSTVLAALDDVATVRRRAVIALANFEGPEVDLALHHALDDRDWQVRQAAEDLLAVDADPSPGGEVDSDLSC